MPDLDRRLSATFVAQQSLVTRRQVLAAGGSDAAIQRRLRSGVWDRARARGLALAGVAWNWRRNLAAVVLSVPGAMASHRASAKLLGAHWDDRATSPVELTVPEKRYPTRDFAATRARLAGVPIVVHESVDLCWWEPVLVDGIPTTPPLRLAVDLGAVIDFDRYRRAVAVLRTQHGIDWTALDRTYRQHSVQGRNGCGALRDLLERHFGTEGAPDEVVEARCADLLVAAGLPVPVHQFEVLRPDGRRVRFDLAYPELRIAIETDGRIHGEHDVRERDNRRRNQVQLLGWQVFHFTWEDVVYRPEYVVATVRAALEAAGATRLGI